MQNALYETCIDTVVIIRNLHRQAIHNTCRSFTAKASLVAVCAKRIVARLATKISDSSDLRYMPVLLS